MIRVIVIISFILASCGPSRKLDNANKTLEAASKLVNNSLATLYPMAGKDSTNFVKGSVETKSDTILRVETTDSLKIERYYYNTLNHSTDTIHHYYKDDKVEKALYERMVEEKYRAEALASSLAESRKVNNRNLFLILTLFLASLLINRFIKR